MPPRGMSISKWFDNSNHQSGGFEISWDLTIRRLIAYWNSVWHDNVIKRKHFPRYWPFVRGIHRSPVNSPHKGQWRGALMLSLICVWINGWVNNREVGDLRRYRAHYDVIAMVSQCQWSSPQENGLATTSWHKTPQSKVKQIKTVGIIYMKQSNLFITQSMGCILRVFFKGILEQNDRGIRIWSHRKHSLHLLNGELWNTYHCITMTS